MAAVRAGDRVGRESRSIQPRTPQQDVGGGFVTYPTTVVLGPNSVELATLEQTYNPTVDPVRGTANQSWDSTSFAGQNLATLKLTRGLYRFEFQAQCYLSNPAGEAVHYKRIDIDILRRSTPVFISRVNFFQNPGTMTHFISNTVNGVFWCFVPDPYGTVEAGYPYLYVKQVDPITGTGRSIGWIQATRCWTDFRDPGE